MSIILIRPVVLSVVFAYALLFSFSTRADLLLTNGGRTVDDTFQGVTWLRNADLAATPGNNFGVPSCDTSTNMRTDCISPNGSMDFQAAQSWVMNLNTANQGAGYLGHNNWQLPSTPNFPTLDQGCASVGAHSESFAYDCSHSALGSLYYAAKSLNLVAPASGAPPAALTAAGFSNLRVAQYWTGTQASDSGYATFNFATGWSGASQGANKIDTTAGSLNFGNIIPHGVIANFFFMLPMLPTLTNPNVPNLGTSLVQDPKTLDYFLKDGNFGQTVAGDTALQQQFGISVCTGTAAAPEIGKSGSPPPAPCVNTDGSMTWTSADALVTAMRNTSYLGQTGWELPPSTLGPGCSYQTCATAGAAAQDPLASVYYNMLNLPAGGSLATMATGTTGPFLNVQPNLYWACPAAQTTLPTLPTSAVVKCDPAHQCADQFNGGPCLVNFDWSFNFADGFQGTDEDANHLFVTAYYVDAVPEPRTLVVLMPALGLLGFVLRQRRKPRHSAARQYSI